MNPLSALAIGFAWLAIVGISWLGWQLLRQNGRLLLRLDELEKRLDELEFGDGNEPAGLPVGSPAPGFELADLAGNSRTLTEFRGRPLLLVFFNPACGFCREMTPRLAAHSPSPPREERDGERRPFDPKTQILIISTSTAETNRTLFDEHKITHPVLLQKEMEVAAAYRANGTPSGYLISADGKIASEFAIGGEAILKLLDLKTENNGSGSAVSGIAAAKPEERTSRFSNRSLTRSKLKRDGLKAGTPAPDFRLPRLDGSGDLELSELRGKRVLLVFSSPHCGPCESLASELEKFHRAQTEREVGRVTPCAPQGEEIFQNGAHGVARPTLTSPSIAVIMISKGEPKENRAKVKEHGLTFPVVLQQQWEISRRYAMFATPIAYLIDEEGVIARDVAVGIEAILEIMTGLSRSEFIEATHASVNPHS